MHTYKCCLLKHNAHPFLLDILHCLFLLFIWSVKCFFESNKINHINLPNKDWCDIFQHQNGHETTQFCRFTCRSPETIQNETIRYDSILNFPHGFDVEVWTRRGILGGPGKRNLCRGAGILYSTLLDETKLYYVY